MISGKSRGINIPPQIEVLELLHDQVDLSVVVVCGEVVHPAAKTLTRVKEAIKPFQITTSWGRTYENLATAIILPDSSTKIADLVRIQSLNLNPGGRGLLW